MLESLAPWFKELLSPHKPPCISLYQPVHRAGPPADEDPIRFRNLLKEAEETLHQQGISHHAIDELLAKLRSAEPQFSHKGGDRDAIAIFASPDYLLILPLQRSTEQAVIVADTFHVKPLIRILQSAGRYHVLALTLRDVWMYEGDRYRLAPLELRNVPQDPSIVAGMRLGDDVTSVTDLAEASRQMSNEGQDQATASTEEFFHAVDKAIWENYSRPAQIPLILAAADRQHPLFRQISRNPYLTATGILLDPKNLPLDRLRQEAWAIISPRYEAELARLKEMFTNAKAHRHGSDDLAQVAQASATGRVNTLLIESDRQIPGHVDPITGIVLQSTPPTPGDEDVLDDLAELVMRKDGQVLVIPPEQMPTDQGLAAIYRY